MDCKAVVKVGEFDRGGRSYVAVNALDHDYQPDLVVTPIGILVVPTHEISIYLTDSKATADCLVDCLELWWTRVSDRWQNVDTLVLLLDNGPENKSRRTQFMKRIVDFVHQFRLRIVLAYYPPYHSKYNPVERVWGVLENYWSAALLDSREAVFGYASNMKWRDRHPTVQWVTRTYLLKVKLSACEMRKIEEKIHRLPGLQNWFVDIAPHGCTKYFAG